MANSSYIRSIAILIIVVTFCLGWTQNDPTGTNSAASTQLKLLFVTDIQSEDVELRSIAEKTVKEYSSPNLQVDVVAKNELIDWISQNCAEYQMSREELKTLKYAEKHGYAAVGGIDRIIKKKNTRIPSRQPRAKELPHVPASREIAPWIYNLRRGSYSFGVDQAVLSSDAPVRLTDQIELRCPAKGKAPFTLPVDFTREHAYEPFSVVTSLKMHEQLEAWAWGAGGLFVLNGRNGGRIDLTEINSKLIIISFWGVKPPASEAHLLPLTLIQNRYSRTDLCWLNINADLSRTEWLRYLDQNPLGGMQCILGQSNVQPEFRQFGRSFIMDREKRTLREYELADLAIVVDRLLRK